MSKLRRWLSELRYDFYHLRLCWKERGKWSMDPDASATGSGPWAMDDGGSTRKMTVWEVFRDKHIRPCPIYGDHLSGSLYGCYECQCKAHDDGWYDMDSGYVRM